MTITDRLTRLEALHAESARISRDVQETLAFIQRQSREHEARMRKVTAECMACLDAISEVGK